MQAALWFGQKDVRVMDVPEPPAPGRGEVKIAVEWCGICGSDLHEYLAGPIFIPVKEPHPLTGKVAPVILGHEFSGKVVAVGEGVTNVKVGDRVAPDACQVCWDCYWCKRNEYQNCEKLAFTGLATDGGFAEFVNVPAYTCYKIPDEMSYEQGAVVEPIAVGMHAVRKAVVAGDNVVIIGAGTIGLAALQCARTAGAAQIIVLEMAKDRKEYAAKLGATKVIDPSKVDAVAEVFRLTDGIGADVTIECVGSTVTGPLAVDTTRRGGKAVSVGVYERPAQLNFNEIVFKEKQLMGSLAYNGEFAPVIKLLADGRLKAEPMITGKIKLADIVEKGFEELINHKDRNIKIIVSPK